jgi:glycosyltransferase involved in cell wall biosynthesis
MAPDAEIGQPQKKSVRCGRRILVTGTSPYWNDVTADLLRVGGFSCDVLHGRPHWQVFRWLLCFKWHKYNLLYQVSPSGHWLITALMILIRIPCIIHWIGTDVLSFKQGKMSRGWRNRLLQKIFHRRAPLIHLADSPELAEELHQAGISSGVIPLIPKKAQAEVYDLPIQSKILSYWPDDRKDFYQGDLVLRLAEEFPATPFLILGAAGKNVMAPPNVRFLGRRKDIETIYRDVSVLIRMPIHDSLGMMVVEMLARGRYVLYNKPFTHCHLVHTFEQAREALIEVLKKTEPNREGAHYIQDHFSPEKEAKKLAEICGSFLDGN